MRSRILAFLFATVFGITLCMSIGCKEKAQTADKPDQPAAEQPAEAAKDAPAEKTEEKK